MYCTGWIKRGPKGIVGTNIADARETAQTILEQFGGGYRTEKSGEFSDIVELLKSRGVKYINWEGWMKVDERERDKERKRVDEQPREKFTNDREIIQIANGDAT